MAFLIGLVAAYLIGSVPFAVIVSRVAGLKDPRTFGSGNPGATNVLRTGNKAAALITLLGDALKGATVVWLGIVLQPALNFEATQIAWFGLAAFVGHVHSIFLKLKGGKGVATALGVLIAMNWILGLACAATWLIIALFFRFSSLASIITAIFAVFYTALLFGVNAQLLAIASMSAILIFKHKTNIIKLIKGQETKIGQR